MLFGEKGITHRRSLPSPSSLLWRSEGKKRGGGGEFAPKWKDIDIVKFTDLCTRLREVRKYQVNDGSSGGAMC